MQFHRFQSCFGVIDPFGLNPALETNLMDDHNPTETDRGRQDSVPL